MGCTASKKAKHVEEPVEVTKETVSEEKTTVIEIKPDEAVVQQEEKAAEEPAKKILFEDNEFPPVNSSIFISQDNLPSWSADIQWKRPSEVVKNPSVFVGGVDEADVVQGVLNDCWFLGALSCIATKEQMLYKLFLDADKEYDGKYQLQFFKNGEWVQVTIDDRIPMKGDMPLFGRCTDSKEIWVPLAEKAYAKLHGCYQAIEFGSVSEGLSDCSGGLRQEIYLTDEPVQEEIVSGKFWNRLEDYFNEGHLLGCAMINDHDESGLLNNHAYGIFDLKTLKDGTRLLRIRNPWSIGEWTGKWSDGSSEWTEDALKDLNYSFNTSDGTFWIEYTDFVKHFNVVYVCLIFDSSWKSMFIKGKWTEESAGGCSSHTSWHTNPQYTLKVSKKGRVVINIQQDDARLSVAKTKTTTFDKAVGFDLVHVKDKPNSASRIIFPNNSVAVSQFNQSRDVTLELKDVLEPGETYVLVPCTFEKGKVGNYYLTLYSDCDVELTPVSEIAIVSAQGEWNSETSGGSYENDTWPNNPQFMVEIDKPVSDMMVTLIQNGNQQETFEPISVVVALIPSENQKIEQKEDILEVICYSEFFKTQLVYFDNIIFTPQEEGTKFVIIPTCQTIFEEGSAPRQFTVMVSSPSVEKDSVKLTRIN